MGQPKPLSRLFLVFFQQTLHFFITKNVINVHPVFSAGIRTHNLQIASLVQLPLDQVSLPISCYVVLSIFVAKVYLERRVNKFHLNDPSFPKSFCLQN